MGIWFMLFILLSGLEVNARPKPERLVKQFLVWNFLTAHNLFDGRFILQFKDQLSLTPVQEKKIEKLMLVFEELSISRCAEIKIKELRLVSAIKSDQIVRENIESKIREISNNKIDLSIAYLNYLLDIKMILTAEQITVLGKIKKHITHKILKKPLNLHQQKIP